ncbi:hypothetical protein L6Q96_11695 [Candidatus Binatia bacterium]|nr:hypothetical protein [Candidatus Binatia bacterium]
MQPAFRNILFVVVAAGLFTLSGCGDDDGVPVPPEPGACGNGVVEPGEDCDDGGICIGGNLAGSGCTSNGACGGDAQPGVCLAGTKVGTACDDDGDCPGSMCDRCVTFGGDGCAANCTFETEVAFPLVPGVAIPGGIQPGTSGVITYGQIVARLPIPLSGDQTLTIGKERDGEIPAVIKADSVVFPKVQVATLACACVRGFAAKTCGGTIFEADGTPSPLCGDGIVSPTVCPAARPCTFVNGPGNSAAGVIGCGGLDAIDSVITQDCHPDGGGPAEPREIALSGAGPSGSARLMNTIRIGTQSGLCTPTFCSDSDPVEVRGTPVTLPYVTGSTSATVFHAGAVGGPQLGPQGATGGVFQCAALTQSPPSAAGANLAASFTSCASALGDVVLTNNLVAGVPHE